MVSPFSEPCHGRIIIARVPRPQNCRLEANPYDWIPGPSGKFLLPVLEAGTKVTTTTSSTESTSRTRFSFQLRPALRRSHPCNLLAIIVNVPVACQAYDEAHPTIDHSPAARILVTRSFAITQNFPKCYQNILPTVVRTVFLWSPT